MSNTATKIEWCDTTWSPVTGCQKVSDGCKNCYAERVFNRMAANPKTPAYHGRKFTDVVCHEELAKNALAACLTGANGTNFREGRNET